MTYFALTLSTRTRSPSRNSWLTISRIRSTIARSASGLSATSVREILLLGADFVRVAQKRSDEALIERLERDDVLAIRQHHPADRDLVHLADGLADHGEGVVADLAVGPQLVGPDQVARVDLATVDELVDLDGVPGP